MMLSRAVRPRSYLPVIMPLICSTEPRTGSRCTSSFSRAKKPSLCPISSTQLAPGKWLTSSLVCAMAGAAASSAPAIRLTSNLRMIPNLLRFTGTLGLRKPRDQPLGVARMDRREIFRRHATLVERIELVIGEIGEVGAIGDLRNRRELRQRGKRRRG